MKDWAARSFILQRDREFFESNCPYAVRYKLSSCEVQSCTV